MSVVAGRVTADMVLRPNFGLHKERENGKNVQHPESGAGASASIDLSSAVQEIGLIFLAGCRWRRATQLAQRRSSSMSADEVQ